MKISGGFLVAVICLFIAAYGGQGQAIEESTNATVADNDTTVLRANVAPLAPYPRLLPLQLTTPPTAQAGIPLIGVSVSLQNPGDRAPNARLRLIIHESAHGHAGDHRALSPDNVNIEVLQGGDWIPVLLGMVSGNVMGAIGPEGVTAHRERYQRNGFEIPPGLNKTWQLRVTFNLPGTYSLVAAVSPDNGSTHLAQPAHSLIEVQ